MNVGISEMLVTSAAFCGVAFHKIGAFSIYTVPCSHFVICTGGERSENSNKHDCELSGLTFFELTKYNLEEKRSHQYSVPAAWCQLGLADRYNATLCTLPLYLTSGSGFVIAQVFWSREITTFLKLIYVEIADPSGRAV
jgi:hypothetical protein